MEKPQHSRACRSHTSAGGKSITSTPFFSCLISNKCFAPRRAILGLVFSPPRMIHHARYIPYLSIYSRSCASHTISRISRISGRVFLSHMSRRCYSTLTLSPAQALALGHRSKRVFAPPPYRGRRRWEGRASGRVCRKRTRASPTASFATPNPRFKSHPAHHLLTTTRCLLRARPPRCVR